MPRVYIINSPDDDGVASAARCLLEANNVSCISPQQAAGGRPEEQAKKLIGRSDLVILILSSSASNSVPVKREVECAARMNKLLIPFRVDSAPIAKHLELYLGATHWLDATTPQMDQHLAQLVSTVRRLGGLEKEYRHQSSFINGRRASKKAIASLVCGALGILTVQLLFSPLGVILGRSELKSINAGRSPAAGRKYARAGMICGLVGVMLGCLHIFLILYLGVDWPEVIARRLEGLLWPTPLGPS